MYILLRFFLFLLPPDTAHAVTLKLLRYTLPSCLGRWLIKRRVHNPVSCAGLSLPNPIGLAAGFDKNGEAIDALFALGFGFVEVGGVTPRPQQGNPLPHVTRLLSKRSLLNRGGFKNKGVDALVGRLKQRRLPGVLGVNIAPNTDTPNEHAIDDYLLCLQKVYPYVDYVTVNISCPNSADLVALQTGEHLDALLVALYAERDRLAEMHHQKKPLFIKVSPDLDDEAITMMAACFLKHHVDAVVVTNTSKGRSGIEDLPEAELTGGLSGEVLFPLSLSMIEKMAVATQHNIPLIAVGGIASAENVAACYRAGASLAAVYTALIYQGPGLIRDLAKRKPG